MFLSTIRRPDKKKPSTGLKTGKKEKAGENPANPKNSSKSMNEMKRVANIIIFRLKQILTPLFLYLDFWKLHQLDDFLFFWFSTKTPKNVYILLFLQL